MTFKQVTIGLLAIVLIIQGVCLYTLFMDKKVVYVDTNVLLENYEGMKVARQEFQQKATQWQANLDTLRSELNREIQNYEAGKSGMSTKERELNEKLIGTKQQQLVDYQKGIQQKSQQEDYQMTEQILAEVNAFIESYGKKKGYTYILGANNSGNIVYAEDYLDITEELQEALNKNYQGF
ncbi:OmpH family outer membrane protein [Ekhidna sp.]|jgi:outer membrane protein|uniref:OmpH family outer membrane protein n=1 Tax=Ekhidna sp. TaxID=2608089 RepID=UPI0032EFE125